MFFVFVMVLSLVYMFDNPLVSVLTEGLIVDCNVTCSNVGFLGLGVVRFGCICELLCCVVVTIVSTFFSITKCEGV